MTFRFSTGLLVGLACCISLAGCGTDKKIEGRTSASGAVTLDGNPMKGGSLTFKSKQPSGVQTTCLITAGRYECDRVPVGECVITVETESLKYGNAAAYTAIPKKYTDSSTTDLTANFKEGENSDVNIELKSK